MGRSQQLRLLFRHQLFFVFAPGLHDSSACRLTHPPVTVIVAVLGGLPLLQTVDALARYGREESRPRKT